MHENKNKNDIQKLIYQWPFPMNKNAKKDVGQK